LLVFKWMIQSLTGSRLNIESYSFPEPEMQALTRFEPIIR